MSFRATAGGYGGTHGLYGAAYRLQLHSLTVRILCLRICSIEIWSIREVREGSLFCYSYFLSFYETFVGFNSFISWCLQNRLKIAPSLSILFLSKQIASLSHPYYLYSVSLLTPHTLLSWSLLFTLIIYFF